MVVVVVVVVVVVMMMMMMMYEDNELTVRLYNINIYFGEQMFQACIFTLLFEKMVMKVTRTTLLQEYDL
jgi:hypothetical protein